MTNLSYNKDMNMANSSVDVNKHAKKAAFSSF
ncbi:hypothetical protein J601_3244, partial [Acinetobacter baumannii 831240]